MYLALFTKKSVILQYNLAANATHSFGLIKRKFITNNTTVYKNSQNVKDVQNLFFY